MYRRPRRKPYRGWLVVLVAAAVLGLAIFGIVKLITGTPSLDSDAVSLPTPYGEGVFAWSDGVLCIDGKTLICTDMKGEPVWRTDLPSEGMKASRDGELTIAYGGNVVLVIDAEGIIKKTMNTPGEVVMAVPGIGTYAVVTKEENQHRLRLYSVKDYEQVDEELFPYQSVLGVGFYGDSLNQVWTLAVDSHGTQPVTKLTTYYPGKSTTGELKLTGEIGYSAVLKNKMIYITGTHTLTFWEQTGKEKDRKQIYGWNLEDRLVEDGGRVSFLLAPTAGNDSGQISMLWYVNTDGEEYRIPLPAGCFKAMLGNDGRICVATRYGVYSMAKNGTGSRFYPFSNAIESIPAVVPGKAFVVEYSHRNYLINMP